jgi:hypothetical protein
MNSRSFIPCNEHPLLAELTTAHANLVATLDTIRELATFSGPVGVISNGLGEEARDTMMVELEWQLPKLYLAQSAFNEVFERFGAESSWPPLLRSTVQVNYHGAHELVKTTIDRIAEAEKSLSKNLAAAKRRVEKRYLKALPAKAQAA